MKRLILLLVAICCYLNSYATFNPQGLANNQLRAIFGHLDLPPVNTRHFLYDMSAHTVDEAFFSSMATKQSNTDNWFLLYEEMYHAAYDQSLWDTPDDIFDKVYNNPNGHIPIGIMDFDFYRLKGDALTTGNYFHFDLANNKLFDIPGRPSYPYYVDNVFSAAPLVQSTSLQEVTFSIGPDLYYDNYNAPYYNAPYAVRINFDDGTGWHTFYTPTNDTYTAEYLVIGDKNIEVEILNDNGKAIKRSNSLFIVGNTHAKVNPDFEITNVPGLKASAFLSCTNTTGQLQKVLIYVEGYEILDFLKVLPFYKNQKMEEDYAEMLEQTELGQLQNFGYDILMVDFGSTGKSIHENAMSLINLIDYLKCNATNDQQFVILGHSMGGVISKYALAYMEDYPYTGIFNCQNSKSHNTRLLITNDSPHQGANIPLSIQHLYRIGFDALPGQSAVKRKLAEKFNVMLDSKGVKELLKYHVDTRDSNGSYTHHDRRGNFLTAQSNLSNGGNPRHCKLMALSDGSMSGLAQTNPAGKFRVANDILLDMSASVYLRILGIKVLGTDADFTLRTNPHWVSGNLLEANVEAWHPKIEFFWFGVRLKKQKYTLYNKKITAKNISSFCTSAGGIYKFSLFKGEPYNNCFSLPPLGSFTSSSSGTGNLNFHISTGSPWLANANLSFSLITDGLYWNFVPVGSALDYTQGSQSNTTIDIESSYDPGATPFDVIVGISDDFIGPKPWAKYNRHHRFMRNEGTIVHSSCPSFKNGKDHFRRLLNQEIGEDVLYLNNMDLNRLGGYEAQFDILASYRNPSYNYSFSSSGLFPATYSKNRCFTITGPNGHAIFNYDAANSPNTLMGLQFNPSCPIPNTAVYTTNDYPQTICCIDYTVLREEISEHPVFTAVKSEVPMSMSISPNPAKNGDFTIHLDQLAGTEAEVRLMDLMGNTLLTQSFKDLSKAKKLQLNLSIHTINPLAAGAYLISVSDGKTNVTQKLMILN